MEESNGRRQTGISRSTAIFHRHVRGPDDILAQSGPPVEAS